MNRTGFHCRSCGGRHLHPVLSLGETPLANALLGEEDLLRPEARYPLDLVFCADCSLVQITETVPPEALFSDYVYFSSYSDTAVEAARILAERLVREDALGPDSLVLEAASNDGYLLQHYRRLGVPVLGIEPARNIARVAEEKGIPTRCAFFGRELAAALREEGGPADLFHAHNVLAHVPDLNGFVAGIAAVLKPDGQAVVEAPYVRDLVEHVEFDTIYHEHLCYFSATAVDRLVARHGLRLFDLERLPIHGGSLRLFLTPEDSPRPRSERVDRLLEEERAQGMDRIDFYRSFAERVERLGRDLCTRLRQFKAEGCRLAAYGASAKGSTLLNVFGIGRDLLDYVVDRSPVKQGQYTPGSRLLIRAPETLAQDRPDYVLLLTWNFEAEILAQQAAYRETGGRFIVPVPRVRIL